MRYGIDWQEGMSVTIPARVTRGRIAGAPPELAPAKEKGSVTSLTLEKDRNCPQRFAQSSFPQSA
jgi:hypothetical protein